MFAPGQSLLGFFPDALTAVGYQSIFCRWPDPSTPALQLHWSAARCRRGPPIPHAGMPELLPLGLPFSSTPGSLVTDIVPRAPAQGVSCILVEIGPLLVPRFHIRSDLVERYRSALPPNPCFDDAMALCLPRWGAAHPAPTHHVAPCFVVRVGGRSHLARGVHRACALWQRGIKYIPAVVIDVDDYRQIGLSSDTAFDQRVLESPDPPTCYHLILGRAYPVRLRTVAFS